MPAGQNEEGIRGVLWRVHSYGAPPMEMSQNVQDEAAYISQSFGVPLTTALEVTLAVAQRVGDTKKSKKRVDRK
jgi:hypothetical protein